MIAGTMRRGATGAMAVAISFGLGAARAAGPEVVDAVPGTGTPVGVVARADGGFPFLSQAAADRTACMLDRRWVGLRQLRALAARGRRDRDGAYGDMVRVTGRCMAAKGWTFTPCGPEASCPAPSAAE